MAEAAQGVMTASRRRCCSCAAQHSGHGRAPCGGEAKFAACLPASSCLEHIEPGLRMCASRAGYAGPFGAGGGAACSQRPPSRTARRATGARRALRELPPAGDVPTQKSASIGVLGTRCKSADCLSQWAGEGWEARDTLVLRPQTHSRGAQKCSNHPLAAMCMAGRLLLTEACGAEGGTAAWRPPQAVPSFWWKPVGQ